MKIHRIAVIGAGSWGTTLADLLARKGLSVALWAREPELVEAIEKKRENTLFLPGVELSEAIEPTGSVAGALEGADLVVSSVPSHGVRAVFSGAKEFLPKDALIVSTSKGIEEGTLLTCSAILKEILPESFHKRISVLSGPSFAKEVSRGKPTAVCVASVDKGVSELVQRVFSTGRFRVYTNTDLTGVELGGALKNVIALGAGISDGLGLGSNARAALITRGLAEITRLGVRMGADQRTFYGLSGMGDLVLTCTGELSRNHTVGVALGMGRRLDEVVSEMKMVAEGVKTSIAARELARKHSVEMPITEEVCRVLYEGKDPERAVMELMTRRLKEEYS